MCQTIQYPAPSGANNSIEFVFDRPYVCGQFANGDWWVSDKRGVVIQKIMPESDAGMHGFEVNPIHKNKQAFDSRIAGYDKTLMPKLPLRLEGVVSIVKGVSVPVAANCRPCVQFAAVLTVLSEIPVNPSAQLRPAYFGKSKQLVTINGRGADKLGRLVGFGIRGKDQASLDWAKRRYQHVQLDHFEGWQGRFLHPKDNMPDYGADIARDNAVAVLRMLLDDFDDENESNKRLLAGYLQMAVDFYGMAQSGVHWTEVGHGSGRKLPLVFAGLFLRDLDLDRILKDVKFAEDEGVYYSSVAGMVLYGVQCSDEDYWRVQRTGKGSRICRDPYGWIDGGGAEVGAAYQFCCTAKPWKYTVLAVELLALQQQWGDSKLQQYVERWVKSGAHTKPDECAAYNDNPGAYKQLYGPSENPHQCIKGDGRFISKHGIGAGQGYYGSDFGDHMWQRFKVKGKTWPQ